MPACVPRLGIEWGHGLLIMTKPYSRKRERLLLSALRLKCRLGNMASRIWSKTNTVYVWDRIPFYRQMWAAAASKLSAQFSELADGIWNIRLGTSQTYINIHRVQLDDAVISSLSGNKPFCYEVLRKEHIPVPDHVTFRADELDRAWQFMKRKKGFYVVKPALETGSGMGVTTHVQSLQECRYAIALASLYGRLIILEDLVPGECYRLLILNGKMIHAVRRRGVRIQGDGRSTIAQLIEQENKRRREEHAAHAGQPITWNRDMAATLLAQGLSADSVIQDKREVLVQSHDAPDAKHVEVRTVYDEVATGLICKELRQQVERAAMLLHSKFAGVDVITLDPSLPLEKSGGVINEINTNPGLHHHYVSSSHDACRTSDDIGPTVSVLTHLLGQNGRLDNEEMPALQGERGKP